MYAYGDGQLKLTQADGEFIVKVFCSRKLCNIYCALMSCLLCNALNRRFIFKIRFGFFFLYTLYVLISIYE